MPENALSRDYEIQQDQPVPELAQEDIRSVLAFHRYREARYVALLAPRKALPRLNILEPLRRCRDPFLMVPVEAGHLQNTQSERQEEETTPDGDDDAPPTERPGAEVAFIVQRPGGSALLPASADDPEPLRTDLIIEELLKPAARLLSWFQQNELFHGYIHPCNLFFEHARKNTLVLGPCFATAPGRSLPAIYEPPMRGLCHPYAKGPGSTADDMYALGVTAAALWQGGLVLRENDPNQLATLKLRNGSFKTLVDRTHQTDPFVEILKGLLEDDPNERWSPDHLNAYLRSGGTASSRKPTLRQNPTIGFRGGSYETPRALSHAVHRERAEPPQESEIRSIGNWAASALKMRIVADRLEEVKTQHFQKRRSADDGRNAFVARICIALDPHGPLRWEDLGLMPQGLGTLIAHGFLTEAMETGIKPIIEEGLPLQAEEYIQEEYARSGEEEQKKSKGPNPILRQLANIAARSQPGYGLERVMYEMDANVPCLSPLLGETFASNLREVFIALEASAENFSKDTKLFERHLIAFLFAKLRKIPRQAEQFSRENLYAYLRGLTALLDECQREADIAAPNLLAWFAQQLEPLVEGLHSRTTRRKMRDIIQRAVKEGYLYPLLDSFFNEETFHRDRRNFRKSVKKYRELQNKRRELEEDIINSREKTLFVGRQYACAICTGLATILTSGYLLFRFVLGG